MRGNFTYDLENYVARVAITYTTKGETVSFNMVYENSLDSFSENRDLVNWSWIGFWFPIHPKLNNWNLQYDLIVKVDNPEYIPFSNGRVKLESKGYIL